MKMVIRMMCIKEMEVCSLDQKYALQKVTWEECMDYMTCLPSAIIPEEMKHQGCTDLPKADNATAGEGPVFDIKPKQVETARASQSLQQTAFTVAAILAFVFAYIRL